jgi:hypothetical protein
MFSCSKTDSSTRKIKIASQYQTVYPKSPKSQRNCSPEGFLIFVNIVQHVLRQFCNKNRSIYVPNSKAQQQ